APEIEQKQVPVRYDPFDAGTAFAFVRNRWILCHSEYYSVLRGRCEKEMMLATQELHKQHSCHNQLFTLNARRLAEFLKSAEAKDKLMAAIQGSPPNSLVMVLGPTGVGKTTLKAKVEQILTQSLVFALQTDRGRIPVVSVEAVAPESGNFNWRDQFKRILLQ